MPRSRVRSRAETALADVLSRGAEASESNLRAVSHFVFWTLAENCAEHSLPFDLMIGVNRGVQYFDVEFVK